MIRMGIDLGTNYIRLCTQEDGLLYNEPCMVALDNQSHVLGIGEDAKDMIGSTDSNVRIISPLRENPINFDALDILLEQLLYEHKAFKMFQKTILLVSYPTSFSEKSCQILKEHLEDLGAYRVYFEQEIWIAAIGAKLDLFLPVASCVLNIGSSNCDIALFLNGKMEKKARCNVSGITINIALKNWLTNSYNINVSNKQIEKIKRKLGQVNIQQNPKSLEIVGMDKNSHVLKSIIINENQIVGVLTTSTTMGKLDPTIFIKLTNHNATRRKNERNCMLWRIHVTKWTTNLSTKYYRMSNLCHRRSIKHRFSWTHDFIISYGRLS